VDLSSLSEALRRDSKGHSESLIGFATFETSQSYYNAFWQVCQVPTVSTFWHVCEVFIQSVDFR